MSENLKNREENMETAKNEKQNRWDEKIRELEGSADAMGLGIDKGVVETVAALNFLDIPTTASCEGHISEGSNYPWIRIEAPGEPDEKYVGQNEVMQKVADKRGIPFEGVKRMVDFKAWQEAYGIFRKQKLTPGYKEWVGENKKIKKEVVVPLVEEFYKDRKPAHSWSKIQVGGIENVSISPKGVKDDHEPLKKKEKFSKKRKQAAQERLLEYQQEMQAFTQFLKKKYFESK